MFKNLPLLVAAMAVGIGLANGANAQEAAESESAIQSQQEALELRREALAQEREALAQAREQEGEQRALAQRERDEQAKAREEARAQMEAARLELEEAARKVAELSGGPRRFVALRMGPFGDRSVLGVVVEDGEDGVHVTGVTPGGPAASAGVAVGDVITAIDTVTLTGSGSESQRLIEHMTGVDAGQDVVLDIERDGEGREITVAARPGGPNFDRFFFQPGEPGVIVEPGRAGIAIGPNASWAGPNARVFERFLGGRWNELELVALTEELGSYFGTSEGLLVVRAPDDDTIGLQDGDVILEIGGRTPTSPEHAMRILMSFEAGETLRLSIMRRQRRETVEYAIPGNSSQG